MRNGPTVLFRVSMVAFGVVWLTGLGGVQAPLLAADEVEAIISIKDHRVRAG